MIISQAFAQTAPAASGGGTESSLLSLLPLVLMFVVLYFIMIRPQMKRQKEHKAMVEALAKGDEVVTAGGVLGRVSKLGETYLHVEVALKPEPSGVEGRECVVELEAATQYVAAVLDLDLVALGLRRQEERRGQGAVLEQEAVVGRDEDVGGVGAGEFHGSSIEIEPAAEGGTKAIIAGERQGARPELGNLGCRAEDIVRHAQVIAAVENQS